MEPGPHPSGQGGFNTSAKGLRGLFTRRGLPAQSPGHPAAPPGVEAALPGAPSDRSPGVGASSSRGAGPGCAPHVAGSQCHPAADTHGPQHAPTTHVHAAQPLGAHSGGVPELQVQRLLVEPLLDKPFVEGEIWFTVLMDWLNQWKRHVGILPPRKHHHHRQSPGPITTVRDSNLGHSTIKVHADAWRVLVSWYGITEGHKVIKQVAYSYSGRVEMETNLSIFDLTLGCTMADGDRMAITTTVDDKNQFDPSSPCHLVVRLSKLERVGHVEWKSRQLYHVPTQRSSRLWGRAPDADAQWRPLLRRERAVGRALGLVSDSGRSSLHLEVADETGAWVVGMTPVGLHPGVEDEMLGAGFADPQQPSGRLVERSIFDDVTSGWEHEVHTQIERIGQTFVRQVHGSLSGLVLRARDFVADREAGLRARERALEPREEALSRAEELLTQRRADLAEAVREHTAAIGVLEQRRSDHQEELDEERRRHVKEMEQEHWGLQQAREVLLLEKQTFQAELQRMSELNAIQESRVRLDIGGAAFITSRLTLTRDPASMLAAMFSGRHQLTAEPDGAFFIDRDGTHFRYILNYLRDGGIKDGMLPQSKALWWELHIKVEYHQIIGLYEHLHGLLSTPCILTTSLDRVK